MVNYNLEGNINFYEELYKSLDETEDSSVTKDVSFNDTCLITGEPFDKYFFRMECGHKFNYIPLYKDLLSFKNKLSLMEISKVKQNEIRCPYCRKKQTNLLPYYEELNVSKVNGINYWDPEKSEYVVSYLPKWITGQCSIPNCTFTFVKKNSKDEKMYCSKHTKEWNFLCQEHKTIPNIKLHGFTCGTCTQPLKSGKRMGLSCDVIAYTNTNGCCKRHFKSVLKNMPHAVASTVNQINMNENLIIS